MRITRVSLTLGLALPALTAFDCHRLNLHSQSSPLPFEETSSEPRPGRRDARLRPTLLWEKGRTSTHRRHPSRGRFREEAGIGPYGYDAAVGYILEQYQA